MTDIFDQMAEDLFSVPGIGTEAVFTPAAGVPVTLNVSHTRENVAQMPDGYDSGTWGCDDMIEFIYSDIGREPAKGEQFAIGDVKWTVQRVVEKDGKFCKVAVKS